VSPRRPRRVTKPVRLNTVRCRRAWVNKKLSGPELPIGWVVRSERWHAAAVKVRVVRQVLNLPVGMPLVMSICCPALQPAGLEQRSRSGGGLGPLSGLHPIVRPVRARVVQADRPRSRKTETPLLTSVPTNAEREDPGH
jgi:hypothetical protein